MPYDIQRPTSNGGAIISRTVLASVVDERIYIDSEKTRWKVSLVDDDGCAIVPEGRLGDMVRNEGEMYAPTISALNEIVRELGYEGQPITEALLNPKNWGIVGAIDSHRRLEQVELLEQPRATMARTKRASKGFRRHTRQERAAQISRYSRELQAARSENEALRRKVDLLASSLASSERAIASYQNDKKRSRGQQDDLRQRLYDAERNMEILKIAYDKAIAENCNLHAKLKPRTRKKSK